MFIKKTTIPTIALMAILVFTAIPALGATDYKVTVDGSYVDFPDQAPIERDQRILTPIRFPMEAMGVTATWNQEDSQAILTKGSTTAIFTLGETSYTVNGVSKTMDTAPIALNDRTLFPIRFAAEAFGATVTWQAPDTAVITTSTTPASGDWNEYTKIAYETSDPYCELVFYARKGGYVCTKITSHPELNTQNPIADASTIFFAGSRSYWLADYPSGTKIDFEVRFKEISKGEVIGPFLGSWTKP